MNNIGRMFDGLSVSKIRETIGQKVFLYVEQAYNFSLNRNSVRIYTCTVYKKYFEG